MIKPPTSNTQPTPSQHCPFPHSSTPPCRHPLHLHNENLPSLLPHPKDSKLSRLQELQRMLAPSPAVVFPRLEKSLRFSRGARPVVGAGGLRGGVVAMELPVGASGMSPRAGMEGEVEDRREQDEGRRSTRAGSMASVTPQVEFQSLSEPKPVPHWILQLRAQVHRPPLPTAPTPSTSPLPVDSEYVE